ncbi:acetylglutamate kinase [Thalassospiraceae bacterium LMO-JJ14]|nr:acetylglutamate kinase [Thalassospiraceae bacterium LMO-JJ14]
MSKTHDENRENNLAKASVLSEALPYMRRFSGRTVVVKFGGNAMGDQQLFDLFARDMVLLRQVGIRPIVVHGGGPQIGAMLEKLQIKSEFVDGLRVTDQATIDVVEMVLSGSINKQIVAAINNAGGTAIGLSGKDGNLIRAERLTRTKRDPDSNIERVIDLGLVGQPKLISPFVLESFEGSDIIPVIAPIGIGPDGETLNINADTAAGAIAAATQASRMYMLTDVAGVLDQDKNLISELKVSEAREAIENGVITGGMIPKIETCIEAIQGGVDGAAIIDGRVAHTVLVELFTAGGAGTLISRG